MTTEPRSAVLFDTDIGSDIDDAVALAYLLREPRCDLLGITTVSGEPRARAELADAVCRAAGRTDVPVHAGAELPLLGPQLQPHAQQRTVLDRWRHRSDFEEGTAVPFLRESIRARPGAVTLLAVGPLTNVAALFAMDAEVPRLLRRLVWMGGVYTTQVPGATRTEWNAQCDPYAAARVLESPVPWITLFGLDVTLRCLLPAAECRARLHGGPLDVVASMAEVWFGHRDRITFHDPLAAVSLFHAEVCDYAQGEVAVELQSLHTPGMTHWREERSGRHQVAVDVRPEQFFDRFFAVF